MEGHAETHVEVLKSATGGLDRFVQKSKLRRVDHYSRMALLAAGRALEDSGNRTPKEATGLIVATGYGALNSTFAFLDSYIEKGDKLAAPTAFSNSVHNAAAAHISICYGICGPSLTVSQFDLSFVSGLITAATWLETKKADAVLIGAVDEWCDVTGYCMTRFCEESGRRYCSFGEGAAFFMVTRDTGQRPAYGFFEDLSMGRGFDDAEKKSPVDILFSPASAALCKSAAGEMEPDPNSGEIRIRSNGGSPTDMGMDAVYAFFSEREKGQRICCVKQGQDGMFGRVTVTGPEGADK